MMMLVFYTTSSSPFFYFLSTWSSWPPHLRGLLRQINALSNVCDLWHLIVNLSKTKVLIFIISECDLYVYPLYSWGVEIEIWDYHILDILGGQLLRPQLSSVILSSLDLTRDTIFNFNSRISRPRRTSWTLLSDPLHNIALRYGDLAN
jgi:hypothetical protein